MPINMPERMTRPPCVDSGEACRDCSDLPDCWQFDLVRQARIGRELRRDSLVAAAISRRALDILFQPEISHEHALYQELAKQRWGVLKADQRCLKFANDVVSYEYGSELLTTTGHKLQDILNANLRTQPVSHVAIERRASYDSGQDILSRGGGDEFWAIVRNVTMQQFNEIVGRAQCALSIESALGGTQFPVIASVAGMHATELPNDTQETIELRRGEPYLAYQAILEEAGARHDVRKAAQYDEMWACVLAKLSLEERTAAHRPTDNRDIAGRFVEAYFSSSLPTEPAPRLPQQCHPQPRAYRHK